PSPSCSAAPALPAAARRPPDPPDAAHSPPFPTRDEVSGRLFQTYCLRLRFPLLRVVSEHERDGGTGRNPGAAVLALRDVKEAALPVAVAHETEALVGEEPIHDPIDTSTPRRVDPRVAQDLEARRKGGVRRRRGRGGGALERFDPAHELGVVGRDLGELL